MLCVLVLVIRAALVLFLSFFSISWQWCAHDGDGHCSGVGDRGGSGSGGGDGGETVNLNIARWHITNVMVVAVEA